MNFANDKIRIHYWIPLQHDKKLKAKEFSDEPEELKKRDKTVEHGQHHQIKIKFFNRAGYKN